MPQKGETGAIAANHDFAPEAGLQILLDGLAIQTAQAARFLHDVIKHDNREVLCRWGGVTALWLPVQ